MDPETTKVLEEMLDRPMLPPIVLKDFLKEYKVALDENIIPTTESDIQQAMNLSEDLDYFESVAEKCSLNHLMQPDDATIVDYLPGQPEAQRMQPLETPENATELLTFKTLAKNQLYNARNPFRRSSEVFKLAPFPIDDDDDDGTQSTTSNACDYYNDLLISVRIYRPSRATHVGRDLEKPVFAEQFHCLGSNFLTELRDKISCVCNKYHFYDISNDPDAPLPEKQNDPGFFFITDTFYNDKRDPTNPDYSAVLLKWAKQANGIKTAQFKTAFMEGTRFIDLTVSLGFPQLYQHHGNCEHLFTFSQVEVLTPTLTFNKIMTRNSYPRLNSFCIYNNRLCNMCGTVHYVYIVEQSDRQLHDPAYLCTKCFKSFHYIDEKKIGKFQAYCLQDYTTEPFVLNNEIEIDEIDNSNDEENGTANNSTIIESQEHFVLEDAIEIEEMDDSNDDGNETANNSTTIENQEEFVNSNKEEKETAANSTTMENQVLSFNVVYNDKDGDYLIIKDEQ